MVNCTNMTVSGNNIHGNSGDTGISMDANCDYNVISSNLMFSSTGDGVVVAGDNNLIEGNLLNSSGSVVNDTGVGNTKANNV